MATTKRTVGDDSIRDITNRQKDVARKLSKSPNQPPFVKKDAMLTLKRLEKKFK